MPIINKLYPDTKTEENPYTREWVAEQVDNYLKKGGEIKVIPEGETAITEKNYGRAYEN